MVRNRDDESGKYTKEYEDEEFIQAVERLDMPSTSQVAEEVGCSYTLSYHRLNELKDNNELRRLEIGNSFAWIIANR